MLSYKIVGKGKPILLIHGFGISFSIWRNLNPYLKKYYKLIMIELPGIGKSDLNLPESNYYKHCAEKIEELRKKLKLDKWIVVSYSIGTRAAEAYIEKYGRRVASAIFIFPVFISKRKATLIKNLLRIDKWNQSFGNWALSGWRLKLLIILIGFNGRTNKEAKNWHYAISSQPLSTLRATIKDIPDFGMSKFNVSQVPLLFIWGSHDVVPKRPSVHPVDAFVPSGHAGIITHADKIAEAMLSFLRIQSR